MFYPTHFPKSHQARISTRRTTTKVCGKFRAISCLAVVPSSLRLVPHPHYRNRRKEIASQFHMSTWKKFEHKIVTVSLLLTAQETTPRSSGGSVAHVPSVSCTGVIINSDCCVCLIVDDAHHHQPRRRAGSAYSTPMWVVRPKHEQRLEYEGWPHW